MLLENQYYIGKIRLVGFEKKHEACVPFFKVKMRKTFLAKLIDLVDISLVFGFVLKVKKFRVFMS